MNQCQYTNQRGLTLVELMISVALGLIMISGLVTALIGSQRTSTLNTTLSEMQESGRFALDTMIRDIRMAGFQGCAGVSSKPANVRANDAPTINYLADSFQVFEVRSPTVWDPQPSKKLKLSSLRGTPVPGTHAISVQFGSPETYLIDAMASPQSPIVTSNGVSTLVAGDLAIISDCNGADIFEISATSGNSLQHDGTVNKNDDRLSAAYGQGGLKNRPRVMRFNANIFYIGDTGRTDSQNNKIRALYRQTLPYSLAPIELAEGVESLQVRLGVEDPQNPGNITYVTPNNQLLRTHRVRSVQFGFLMQSYDAVSEEKDIRTYHIAGYDIPAVSGKSRNGLGHSTDKKMRLPFNTTVSIRNR